MKLKFLTPWLIASIVLLAGCARDLSSNVYTSDASLNLVLEGTILATRPVIIKETDKLSDNAMGMLGGGAAGGALAGAGGGDGSVIVAGVLAGAVLGSIIESTLGKADGIEYIVNIDRSKLSDKYYEGSNLMRNAVAAAKATGLITVIQGKDQILAAGQNAYVILSPKRARVIAK